MKLLKKIFCVQNVTIFFLIIMIILLTIAIVKFKDNEVCENSNSDTYNFDDNKIYCDREYYYSSSDTYLINLCDNKLSISKNNESPNEIDIKEIKELYNYYTISGNLFYILTKNGDVYQLPVENIINESYTVEKLDLKNIKEIKDFYIGSSILDAYNYKIYAIDKNNNMNIIK